MLRLSLQQQALLFLLPTLSIVCSLPFLRVIFAVGESYFCFISSLYARPIFLFYSIFYLVPPSSQFTSYLISLTLTSAATKAVPYSTHFLLTLWQDTVSHI